MGEHIVDGEFQSDKYPTCPRGKVPLSTRDPMAQDLLWMYAQRRRAVDRAFADDLEQALLAKGYVRPATAGTTGQWALIMHDDADLSQVRALRNSAEKGFSITPAERVMVRAQLVQLGFDWSVDKDDDVAR